MKIKLDKFIICPIIIFSCLYLPFLNIIPYLDGNIDFVQVFDYQQGGFVQYFQRWGSVHPPLKLIISKLLIDLIGEKIIAYELLGYLFGIIGIVTIYFLSHRMFNRNVARISSLLLASSPMYISNGIFSLRDYLLTCLILASLTCLAYQKYSLYAVLVTFAFLSKESAILLILCSLLAELIFLSRRTRLNELFYHFLPLFASFGWWQFLKINHQKSWSDWIFAETASKGTYYTMINNILTLKIFNQYAYQHWLQLFFLNFNWFFWLIFALGLVMFLWNSFYREKIFRHFLERTYLAKTATTVALFSVSYFLTVLCFQTYTIPRYILPLIPFLYMAVSFFLGKQMEKNKIIASTVISAITVIVFLSALFSLDPISGKIWGKIKILDQTFYGLSNHLAGNDGITYNLQFLLLAKKRNDLILAANRQKQPVVHSECRWIFPDPRNDYQTLRILKLESINLNNPCVYLKNE